jgi:hypothetical protein
MFNEKWIQIEIIDHDSVEEMYSHFTNFWSLNLEQAFVSDTAVHDLLLFWAYYCSFIDCELWHFGCIHIFIFHPDSVFMHKYCNTAWEE